MVFTDSISSTLPHPMTWRLTHSSPTLFFLFLSSQETMNELLESAEFLVHVAVPGAVAKPAIDAIGGDAPSWDVEGGGAWVPDTSVGFPDCCFVFRLCVWLRCRVGAVSSVDDYNTRQTPSFGSEIHCW
jgi:hypothetical protein